MKKILFTGGSGLLGSEFKKIVPGGLYPTHKEFDVINYKKLERYIKNKKENISAIVHAAAFISPPKVDKDPLLTMETNIIGTANIVKLCMENNIRLIYISSDYVFKGDKGKYQEEDGLYPVNKYGWSKLGGECAVQMYDNSLIIRTTFGPNIFPYEGAFIDQWTSREKVSIIAKLIIRLVKKKAKGIYHVGGKRKTVFNYAKSVSPDKKIKKISIKDMPFKIPKDVSLDCSKQDKFLNLKW